MKLIQIPFLKSCAVLGFSALTTVSVCHAQDYSLDPLSPEVPGTFSAADGVPFTGTPAGATTFTAADVTLVVGENVDAFSYGQDFLTPNVPDESRFVFYTYSVDRATVGTASGVVAGQVTTDGAAGDAFRLVSTVNKLYSTTPFLFINSTGHGLTPGPGTGQSDVDGHSLPAGASATGGVFFSIDSASATSAGTRWAITASPADVYYVVPPGATPPAVPATYATAAALGLVAGDNIDALAINDGGAAGALDGADIVYVSLAAGSPTLAAIGASSASIIEVFPGPPVEIFAPIDLALLPTDELNALTTGDPGTNYGTTTQQVPTLSQWGMLIFALLVLTIGYRNIRNHV